MLNEEPRERNARIHALDDSCGGGAIDNKLYEKSLFMYVVALHSN
jgi:hypothetical protein